MDDIQATRQIWLLGQCTLKDENNRFPIPPGQIQQLIAYLCLHPRGERRDVLADHLWPQAPPERVGANLSNLLYRFKKWLGDQWLEIEQDQIRLKDIHTLWVDAWVLEKHIQEQKVGQTIALYSGDLLPELSASWILPQRVRLRELFQASLNRYGAMAEANNQFATAFTTYHRLSHLDPLNEQAHQGLMRLYARNGRYRAALQQYAQLEALLKAELEVEPLPQTQELARSIEAEAAALPTTTSTPAPFIGRRQVRAALLRHVETAASGRGNLLFVEGPAGIGKTTLLQNISEGAAWRL